VATCHSFYVYFYLLRYITEHDRFTSHIFSMTRQTLSEWNWWWYCMDLITYCSCNESWAGWIWCLKTGKAEYFLAIIFIQPQPFSERVAILQPPFPSRQRWLSLREMVVSPSCMSFLAMSSAAVSYLAKWVIPSATVSYQTKVAIPNWKGRLFPQPHVLLGNFLSRRFLSGKDGYTHSRRLIPGKGCCFLSCCFLPGKDGYTNSRWFLPGKVGYSLGRRFPPGTGGFFLSWCFLPGKADIPSAAVSHLASVAVYPAAVFYLAKMAVFSAGVFYLEKVAVSSAAVFYLAKMAIPSATVSNLVNMSIVTQSPFRTSKARVITSAVVSHLALVAVSSAAVFFYLAKADIPAAAVFCAAALRAAPPSPPSSSQRPTTCGEASYHVSKRSFS
jgi:hypothetical protein